MKTKKVMSFLMALILSVSLYSCGGDNATGDGEGITENHSDTITGTITNDSNLSTIENFQKNVAEGRFKAPKSSTSRFDYIKDIYSTSSRSTVSFYCNIPFICDDQEYNTISASDIMTRRLNTNGTISRDSVDQGLSTNQTTLRNELRDKLNAAVNRTRPHFNMFYYTQVRANAYAIQPGDDYEYVIDLNVPLAANPVFRRNLQTGETYDFVKEY